MKNHLALRCLCAVLALSIGSSPAGAEGLKFAFEQVANIGGRTAIGDIDLDILSARSWEDPPIRLYRNLTR